MPTKLVKKTQSQSGGQLLLKRKRSSPDFTENLADGDIFSPEMNLFSRENTNLQKYKDYRQYEKNYFYIHNKNLSNPSIKLAPAKIGSIYSTKTTK